MQEFSSVTASSYDAESLAPLLNEKAADGWSVVSIVAAGTNIVAYLQRESAGVSDVVAETERLQARVVRRRVGVNPVGLRVDVQIHDLRQVRSLEEGLLSRQQARNQIRFGVVQMEQVPRTINVHGGVREKELRWAAVDDGAKQVRRGKVIAALCG